MINLYIVNGIDYPRHIGDLLLEYPEYVLGNPLPEGWEEVVEDDPPTSNEGYYYVEGFPVKQDGVWIKSWVQMDASSLVRRSRDSIGTENYEVN